MGCVESYYPYHYIVIVVPYYFVSHCTVRQTSAEHVNTVKSLKNGH